MSATQSIELPRVAHLVIPRRRALPVTGRLLAAALLTLVGLSGTTGCGEEAPPAGPRTGDPPAAVEPLRIVATGAQGNWDTGCPCADASDPDICEPVACDFEQYFDMGIKITNDQDRSVTVSAVKLEILDENGRVVGSAGPDLDVNQIRFSDSEPEFDGTVPAGGRVSLYFSATQPRDRLSDPGSSYQGTARLTLRVDGQTMTVETTGYFGQTVVG